MANTYTLISSITLGSAAATMEFTSIPATYTDLIVKLSTQGTAATPRIRFNNSTSAIYRESLLYGQGTSVASASATTDTWFEWIALSNYGGASNFFANSEFYIPNYAGSNNKSVSADSVQEVNATTGQNLYLDAGLWSSSAAITSIQFFASSGNFVAHSTAYLYGISNA